MRKLIAASASLLLLACSSTSQGQHRAAHGDLRSRMERCSGSPSTIVTPRRPGEGPSEAGVEIAGREGRLESTDIGTCPDVAMAPVDGGPGLDAGARN